MGAEQEDIILSWGHLYLTYNEKCVDSPGECIPNNDIFRLLAKRLGFEEENFKWNDTECLENYIDWDAPACDGIDLNYLKIDNFSGMVSKFFRNIDFTKYDSESLDHFLKSFEFNP